MDNLSSYSKSSNHLYYKPAKDASSNLSSTVWTTRFQNAATNLNRNRQYRHLGNTTSPSGIKVPGQVASQVSSSSVVLPHQQAPNQVSLDHDYCSPTNKLRRQRNISSSSINNQQLKVARNYSTKSYTYVNQPASSNISADALKRVNTAISSGNHQYNSPHIIRKKSTVLAANSVDETTASPIVVPSSQTSTISSSGTTIPLTLRSRPYVRVSTGNRVVTANLLKPTPLSSASMRQSSETTAESTESTINESTSASYSNITGSNLHNENKDTLDVRNTSKHEANAEKLVEHPPITPQQSTSAAATSFGGNNHRRDSDHKKDSGLESGEVSDDSHDGQRRGTGKEAEGYSKLPPYLTTINVSNCSDARSVSAIDEAGCYDRLPAYIRGVGSRGNSVEKVIINSKAGRTNESSSVNGTDAFKGEVSNIRSPPKRKKSSKHHRRKQTTSESSGSRSPSPVGVGTRLRGASKVTNTSVAREKTNSSKRSRRNARQTSSSSSSSSSSSRSSSPESSSSAPSPIKKRKRKASWHKRNRNINGTVPERNSSSKGRILASPRRKFGLRRTASPKRKLSSKNSDAIEIGSVRRFTRDRQRREQENRHNDQENSRQVEERRVVYVGKIAEGTTRADLRKRFEVFGPIVDISVHFRDRG